MTTTDGKVAPDFLFSRIKNVHFSDEWFVVGIGYDFFPLAGQCFVNFPGLAGGTPGIQVFPDPFPANRSVTKGNFTATMRTAAGMSLKGFGAGQFAFPPATDPYELVGPIGNSGFTVGLYNSDPAHHTPTGCEVAFRLSQFGTEPFTVRVAWSGLNTVRPIDLVYFPNGNGRILAGDAVPFKPFSHVVGQACSGYFPPSGPSSFTHNYRVDPTKKTVTTS